MSNNKFESQYGYSFDINNTTSKILFDFNTNVVDPTNSVLGVNNTATEFILLDESQVPGLGTNATVSSNLAITGGATGDIRGSVKQYVFEKLIDPSVVGCENCGDKRKYTPTDVDASGNITDSSVLPIINKDVIAEFEIEPEAYHSFEIDLVGHRRICDDSGNCFTENVNEAAGTTNVNKRSWFSTFVYNSDGTLKTSEANTIVSLFDPSGKFFTGNLYAGVTATNADPSTVTPPFNSENPLSTLEAEAYQFTEYHCCKCCSHFEDFQNGKITESEARSLCEKSRIFIPVSGGSFTQYDYCTMELDAGHNYLSYTKKTFPSTKIRICDKIKDRLNQYGTIPDPNIPQCNNVSFNSIVPLNLTNPNPNSGVENIRVEESELTISSIAPCFVDESSCSFCAELIASGDDTDSCWSACNNLIASGSCGGGGCDGANACADDCRPSGQTGEECIDQQCEVNPCFSTSCVYYNPCSCDGGICTGCAPACGDYNKCLYDSLTGPWSPSARTIPIGYDIGIDQADPSAERISPCEDTVWLKDSSRHSVLLRNIDNSIISAKALLTGRCVDGPGSDSYNDTIFNKACTYLGDAILGGGIENYCALFLNNPLYFNQIWDDTSFNVLGGGFYANKDLRDFIYNQTGTIHFSTNVNSNFLNYKPSTDTGIVYHIEKIKSNNTTYLLNYGNKPTAPAFYDNASAYLSLGYGYTSVLLNGVEKQKYPVVKPYIYYDLASQNYLSEYRTNALAGSTTPGERIFFATYGTTVNGGQGSQITAVNTGNTEIPVTETTYSIPSYSEENLIIIGDNSDTDKSVLTPPVGQQPKQIKKIFAYKTYGIILWEDNTISTLSRWGKTPGSTGVPNISSSSDLFKSKLINIDMNDFMILAIKDNKKITFSGNNDSSMLFNGSFNIGTSFAGFNILQVVISKGATNTNFGFILIDDGSGQNKGTIKGWGTNTNGRCLGTNASNNPITGTANGLNADVKILNNTLTNIIQVETNNSIVMALNSSGDVFAWGLTVSGITNPWAGTDGNNNLLSIEVGKSAPPSGRVQILGTQLTGVKKIVCGSGSYGALLTTDSKKLVLWGNSNKINFDGTNNTALSKTITFTKNIKDIQTVGDGGVVFFEDGTVAQWGSQSLGTERTAIAQLREIGQLAESKSGTGYYMFIKNVNTSGSFINGISLNTWPETNQAFEYTATGRISRQLKRRGGIAEWNGITWDNVYSSTTDPVYPGLLYHSDITPINTLELTNSVRKRNNEISLVNNEYIFTYTPFESNVKTYKNYLVNNGVEQEFTYVTDSRDFQGTMGNFENFKFRGIILGDNKTVEISNTQPVYDSQGVLVSGILPARVLSTLLGSDSGNLNINSLTDPIEVAINAYKFTGGTGGNKLVLDLNQEIFDDGTLVASFSTSGDITSNSGKIIIVLDREFTRTVSGLVRSNVAFMFKVKNNVKGFTDSITFDKTSTIKTSDFTNFAFNGVFTYLDRPPTERARDLGRNEHELFTTKSARFATPDYASWDVTPLFNNGTNNQMVIPFRGLQYQYAKFKPGKGYGISAEVDDYPIIRTIRKNNGKFYIQILAGAFPYYHPLVHEPILYALGIPITESLHITWRNAICNRASNWFNYVATTKWTCHIKHTQLGQNTITWQQPQSSIIGPSKPPKVIGREPTSPITIIGTVPTITTPTSFEEDIGLEAR